MYAAVPPLTVLEHSHGNGPAQPLQPGNPRSLSAPVMPSNCNGSGSTTGSDSINLKSPDKEVVPATPKKSRKDRFHKLFPDVSESDVVIKSYHCAFVGDILLQGFLYVTENWFCFYSKLLGKKRIKISVASVVSITKKKTAIIIPNAVGIYTEKDQYVFGSLMSRDNTYRQLHEVWQQHKLGLEQASMADVDNGIESAIDMDSVANASLNAVSSLSSSEDLVASSSSDDNFMSDLAGSSDKLHPIDSSSPSETCQTSDGLMTFSSDFDAHVLRSFPVVSRLHRCVKLENSVPSVHRLVTWLRSLSKTSLFLLVSTVLVFFLLMSAGLLTYRLLLLQAQLDVAGLHGWPSVDSQYLHSHQVDNTVSDVYSRLRQEYQASTVQQMHKVLEAHVQLLDQVNEALKGLYTWASKNSAPQPTNEEPASRHNELDL